MFEKDTKALIPVDRDNLDLQLFLTHYGIATD